MPTATQTAPRKPTTAADNRSLLLDRQALIDDLERLQDELLERQEAFGEAAEAFRDNSGPAAKKKLDQAAADLKAWQAKIKAEEREIQEHVQTHRSTEELTAEKHAKELQIAEQQRLARWTPAAKLRAAAIQDIERGLRSMDQVRLLVNQASAADGAAPRGSRATFAANSDALTDVKARIAYWLREAGPRAVTSTDELMARLREDKI